MPSKVISTFLSLDFFFSSALFVAVEGVGEGDIVGEGVGVGTGGVVSLSLRHSSVKRSSEALAAGLGVSVDSPFLNVKLGYDTEISDTATTHYGSITLRLAFW